MSTRTRRHAILPVPYDVLLDLLSGKWQLSEVPNLPADVRVVSVHEDWRYYAFCVVLESAEFEEVVEGCIPPYLPFSRWIVPMGQSCADATVKISLDGQPFKGCIVRAVEHYEQMFLDGKPYDLSREEMIEAGLTPLDNLSVSYETDAPHCEVCHKPVDLNSNEEVLRELVPPIEGMSLSEYQTQEFFRLTGRSEWNQTAWKEDIEPKCHYLYWHGKCHPIHQPGARRAEMRPDGSLRWFIIGENSERIYDPEPVE